MEANVVEQNEEMVLQVRYGPATNRPRSAPQPRWQGSLPQGVRKIVTRAALEQHHRKWYAKWARNFALLTDEYIAELWQIHLGALANRRLARGAGLTCSGITFRSVTTSCGYKNTTADGPLSFATPTSILMRIFSRSRTCLCCVPMVFVPFD